MSKLFVLCLVVAVCFATHPKLDRGPAGEVRSQEFRSPHNYPTPHPEPYSNVYPAFTNEEMEQTKSMLDKHNQPVPEVVIDGEETEEEDDDERKERDRAWVFWGFILGGICAVFFTVGHIKRTRHLRQLMQNRRNQLQAPMIVPGHNTPILQNIHELIAYHQAEINQLQAALARQQRPTIQIQEYEPQYVAHEPIPQQSPYHSRVYEV